MIEGFKDLADTVEALREMREAEAGGVPATAVELAELEAALEDEAGDGAGEVEQTATAADDVDVDVLSPSKPPAAKKHKKGGDGASTSRASRDY